MRGYRLRAGLSLLSLISLLVVVNGQYWFQFGVRGGPPSYYNNGTSATIETVTNQGVSSGSLAYWIGETVQNGAFIQVGYVVENESGLFPTNCTISGCSGKEYLSAGEPVWFYEYFPPKYNATFLGSIGPSGSVGHGGAVNNYGFYSSGNNWYVMLNGNTIGSVNLGASSSGPNDPVAFGELANTNGTWTYLKPVTISNVTIYTNGNFLPLSKGYSYIGYGVGSKTNILDPYGVQEVDGKADYLMLGSGIAQPSNNQLLWSLGYELKISSAYGNISRIEGYQSYFSTQISAPDYVYLGHGVREAFGGWVGKGTGSYSGPSMNATVFMDSNVTETAVWNTEYYVNVSSRYSSEVGSGWYAPNSVVFYGIPSNITQVNATARYSFENWSSGAKEISGKLKVYAPVNISAIWLKEYYVNASSDFGNATGSGWYPIGSIAVLQVSEPLHIINETSRLAFYSWSDGDTNYTIGVYVNGPIDLRAVYRKQYAVNFQGVTIYGKPINTSDFYVNNRSVGSSAFLFDKSLYYVNGADYRGQRLEFSQGINVTSPSSIAVKLPLYNVVLHIGDVFGVPVNATATLEFQNGTIRQYNSGDGGYIALYDVPYGKISGTVKYLGLTEIVTTYGTVDRRITFISVTDIVLFVLAVVASVIFYHFGRKKLDEPKAL